MTQKTTYKFTYSLEPEDVIALRKFVLRSPKFYGKAFALMAAFGIIAIPAMFFSLFEIQEFEFYNYLPFIVLLAVAFFVYSQFSKSAILKDEMLKNSFGLIHVELNNEYYTSEANGVIQKFPWTKFEDIHETKEHLFLFINHNCAFILPKAKLTPQEEREAALGFIRSGLKNDFLKKKLILYSSPLLQNRVNRL